MNTTSVHSRFWQIIPLTPWSLFKETEDFVLWSWSWIDCCCLIEFGTNYILSWCDPSSHFQYFPQSTKKSTTVAMKCKTQHFTKQINKTGRTFLKTQAASKRNKTKQQIRAIAKFSEVTSNSNPPPTFLYLDLIYSVNYTITIVWMVFQSLLSTARNTIMGLNWCWTTPSNSAGTLYPSQF